ncbi:MAG: AgmX/PglI C-terminal domain-containing protein [Deltaproteobacteria bacterium]|nr:AgmX/PglI C-terminal domain-containing protein [Deltaproteobacteria bacterium]
MNRCITSLAVLLLSVSPAWAAEDVSQSIRTTVAGALPTVKACYETQLAREPALEGRLVVSVVLASNGTVHEAKVSEDTLGSAAVGACVAGALRELRFPAAAAGARFSYPFVFAPTRTLAVMPFDNLSGDKQLDWLRAGIAESLVTKLGQMNKLVLVDRLKLDQALAEQALGQSGALEPTTAANAGKVIGAQLLVTGAFQKSVDRLRFSARVVDVETSRVRQAVEVTGKLDDVFALQDELAAKVADVMNIPPSPDRDAALALKVARSTSVLRLLGEAANALHGFGRPADRAAAAALYRQAITQDGALPEAHLGLALALMTPGGQDANPDVEAPLRRALELRPNYHEAMTYLAFHLWRTNRNDEAMALEQRAVALKPEYALGNYALCVSLATHGNGDEAIALCRRAVALDPDNHEYRTQTGQLLGVFKRDWAAAAALTRVAVEAGEGSEWYYAAHAHVLLMSGDYPGCLRTVAAGRKARGNNVKPMHVSQATAVEAACRARSGDAKGARAALESLPESPFNAVLTGKVPPPPGMPVFVRILAEDVTAATGAKAATKK